MLVICLLNTTKYSEIPDCYSEIPIQNNKITHFLLYYQCYVDRERESESEGEGEGEERTKKRNIDCEGRSVVERRPAVVTCSERGKVTMAK